MAFRFIRYEIDGGVAVLTLNRPEVLNAFHLEMAREVQTALGQAAGDPAVRAVLLTGEGRASVIGTVVKAVARKR